MSEGKKRPGSSVESWVLVSINSNPTKDLTGPLPKSGSSEDVSSPILVTTESETPVPIIGIQKDLALFAKFALGSSAHFKVDTELSLNEVMLSNDLYSCHAMVDSGATGNFMSLKFFETLGLEPILLSSPKCVCVIDGRELASGSIRYETPPLYVRVAHLVAPELVVFDLIDIPGFDLVLGMPWLSSANPVIDWELGKILGPLPVLRSLVPKQLISAPVEEHYFTILLSSPVAADSALSAYRTVSTTSDSVIDFNSTTDLFGMSPTTDDTSVLVLPTKYRDFADVFEKKAAETLPQHRSYDINIDLKPGAKVPWGLIYLTEPELWELCKYLDENLAHSFIRPSQSPGVL